MQNKLASYIMYVLLILGVILLVVGLVGENYDPMLYYSYALSILAVIGILVGSVFGLMSKPSAIKTIGIGIGGLAVLLGIGFGLADGSVTIKQADAGITESASQWSGAILYMLYIVLLLSILSIVYSLISRLTR